MGLSATPILWRAIKERRSFDPQSSTCTKDKNSSLLDIALCSGT
jgi:hypothetical protein